MSTISLSVIIPVYNSSKTIVRALESIIQQTLLPYEVILINDQSTDNSLEVIQNFIGNTTSEISFKIITLEINSGPSKARNTGWNNANAEYIAFLDSDDSWHPQKLEIQYNFMKNNPNIKLSGHLMELCINGLPNLKEIDFKKINYIDITEKMLINKNYFTTTSNIMIKNDITLRFDQNMRYSEDYYLWLQFCFDYKIALLKYNLGFAYKNFTGVSGLSGNVYSMYKGSLLVSKKLLTSKKISFIQYYTRISFRTIKFLITLIKKFLTYLLKGFK